MMATTEKVLIERSDRKMDLCLFSIKLLHFLLFLLYYVILCYLYYAHEACISHLLFDICNLQIHSLSLLFYSFNLLETRHL